jgi:hypothetical protein
MFGSSFSSASFWVCGGPSWPNGWGGQIVTSPPSGPEQGTIESFYQPGGGLEFFAIAHSPFVLEIYSHARFINLAGGAGFGPEMVDEVATFPQQTSTEKVNMTLASAYRAGGSAHYAVTLPKKCPRGGFPIKAELKFAPHQGTVPTSEGKPNLLLPEQTVAKFYKTACPRK